MHCDNAKHFYLSFFFKINGEKIYLKIGKGDNPLSILSLLFKTKLTDPQQTYIKKSKNFLRKWWMAQVARTGQDRSVV